MTDDAARLNLARRAWQAATPSDAEVEAGAHRVRLAMTRPHARRSGRRRAVAAGVGALALGAALAYAAHSTFTSPAPAPVPEDQAPGVSHHPAAQPLSPSFEQATESPSRAEPEPRRVPATAPAAPRTLEPADHASSQRSTSPSGSEAKADSAGSGRERSAGEREAAADAASWKRVDEALSAGDSQRARAALERLAASDSVTTRAKAQLGLAQLAASAGDCKRARALALQLAASPGVPQALIERGRRLALQCK